MAQRVPNMERISKTDYYLSIAAAVAARSTCLKKHYGAVIVKDDRIVATGYNGSPRGEANCCDTGICYAQTHACPIDEAAATHGSQYGSCVAVHAEQNAIINASAHDLIGATLYLVGYNPRTKEWIEAKPCNICNRMIRNAGIVKIINR